MKVKFFTFQHREDAEKGIADFFKETGVKSDDIVNISFGRYGGFFEILIVYTGK